MLRICRKVNAGHRLVRMDVLLHEVAEGDVMAARHYAQRVLEDFYDDRASVLPLLKKAGRITDEDRAANK